jgi:ABC-type branched-subunit amino acid transport system substrate-binding protein
MKRFVCFWLLFLSAGFCFSAPALSAAEFSFGRQSGALAQESALQEGIDLHAAGESEAAISRLHSFLVRFPESPLLPRAYLYLARIFHEQGQPEKALLYLDRIQPTQRGPEAQLIKGVSLVQTGSAGEGMAILRSLEEKTLGGDDQVARLVALAKGAVQLDLPLQALVFLHQGYSLGYGMEGEAIQQQAHSILVEKLTDLELAEAGFMFRGTSFGADAVLQQAQRALARNEEAAALRLVESALATTAPFFYRDQAVALWERLTGEVWLRRAIGVVLPQSGRFAAFGELVRRGMELAQQIYNANNPPILFLFRDSGADPETCARTVSELANRDRVMAIAGPLTGSAAVAAAERAQQERVPLLTISPREGLPLMGEFVFRNSLTSRLQATALARYAVEEKGMTDFGVLYPDNKLGRELTELFAAEVLKRGGVVVARQKYAEDATDFRRQIRLLKGEDPDAPLEENTPKTEEERQKELTRPDVQAFPSVNFDALFIPDYAERVGLIAPQLAYYGIEDLPLLGINGWNSPELVRVAGRFVEGAVFVDGFFRYSPYPFVEEFVNRYFEKYGEEPSILEAQGFDAANILLTLLDRPEVRSREALRLSLAQLKNYPGVTGGTTFNLQGDADKVLFLLQIQNGNVVQIN